MKTIEQRAAETLQKRIRGSFGYRAAESVVNGFNPEENLCVYKAHGGTRDDLERSLDLVIERSEPQVTAKEIADDLAVDTGEAQAILDEENARYTDMKDHRDNYLTQVQKAFDEAPDSYKVLSQFSVDNFQRIIDNLVRAARAQYARSRNADWANAIQEVTGEALKALTKVAPSQEAPSDKVTA